MLLSGRSQKSAQAAPPPKPNKTQRAKVRALNIDRVSRFLFPMLFACLNVTYWILFWKYI